MLLVANFAYAKNSKMTENLAHWYSSEGTYLDLSNVYQHDRVKIEFKNLCILMHWMKLASAL